MDAVTQDYQIIPVRTGPQLFSSRYRDSETARLDSIFGLHGRQILTGGDNRSDIRYDAFVMKVREMASDDHVKNVVSYLGTLGFRTGYFFGVPLEELKARVADHTIRTIKANDLELAIESEPLQDGLLRGVEQIRIEDTTYVRIS